MHNKIVCVDLDGTIIQYNGWINEFTFGDVLPGAADALRKLKDFDYTIIIYTTRTNKDLVSNCLKRNGVPFDYINENPEQPKNALGGKPMADVYVDDRGLQFDGNWSDTIEKVLSFKTWKEIEADNSKEFGQQFLYHDFEQCFQQMRHYDSQSWDIIKFCFGEVLLAITAIWAIYCFSEEFSSALVSKYFIGLLLVILSISYLFVFISSYLVARNRVYFVRASRYVNELRSLALGNRPYGFRNIYNYYNDYNLPKVNELKSTQLVGMYALISLGLLCFIGILCCLIYNYVNLPYKVFVVIGTSILGYLPFYFGCIRYLKNQNKKMKPSNVK